MPRSCPGTGAARFRSLALPETPPLIPQLPSPRPIPDGYAAPAEPATPVPLPPPAASSVVEIEFASGARMRIAGAVDPSVASAMIAALTTTKRRRRQ